MTMRRSLRTTLTIVALLALAALLATPVPAQTAEKKTFTFTTAPVAAGDADARLAFTITNTAPNQDLGSANVTVPAPFVVDGVVDDDGAVRPADQTIELRDLDLAPGDAIEVVVVADVQLCVPGASEAFVVDVKQSNTFLGTGNDFVLADDGSDLTTTIEGTCSLVFSAQPADAERDAAITSATYDTAGAPIEVRVLDASDEPTVATHSTATIVLTARNPDVDPDAIVPGGTTTATADAGVATFAPGPTLSTSAFEYRLRATADLDGDGAVDQTADSTLFDIVDEAVVCRPGTPCTATAERADQRVSVTFTEPGPAEFLLLVSINAADAPDLAALGCEGLSDDLDVLTGQFFTSDDDLDPVDGELTYDIPSASRPLKQYDICWAAPYAFPTDGGDQATVQPVDGITKPDGTPVDGLAVGFLPDCKRNAPAPPCVRDRAFVEGTSVARVSVATDSRDPWARH